MRLKRIELYGFKSFGQKTVLHFDHPISVIVGPNGSGKSNIADAIRWVLGEQSAKSLRGGKMEDVIFSGTDHKKPLNMTQVSLVLDNRTQALPVAYDEVVVTRKLFRSGETEYSLNKSNCRLKDIRALFMDTGVGKEGYSIIGQGKIDEIISARDQDRRELFEEATGISKFRYQIEEARTKLRKTKENLVRVEDILSQLKEQLRYLSKEADKARRGMQLTVEHEAHTLAYYDREMNASQVLVAGLQEEKALLHEQMQTVTKQRESLLQTLRPLLTEKEQYEQQLQSQEQETANVRNRLEAAERNLQLSVQKSEFLQKDRHRLHEQRLSLEEELKRSEEKLIDYRQEETAAEEYLKNTLREQNGHEQRLQTLRETAQKAQQHLQQTRREVKELERALQETLLLMHTRENAVQLRAGQAEQLHVSVRQETKRYEQSQNEHAELSEESDRVERQYTELVAQLEQYAKEIGELDEQLAAGEASVRENQNAYDQKQRRWQTIDLMIRNHEGYHKSVQQLLRAAEKDAALRGKFLGPLGSLIRVEPALRVAIEIALGAAMHQIVTREAVQAKQLIEWLKKNRVGRATFLPMNQIKAFDYKGAWPTPAEGGVGPALSFVQAEPSLQTILSSLLGRTAIIETIDAGIALRKQAKYDKLRFVTREGELLLPGGSMVGGYTQKEGGLLSRETEKDRLETELELLKTRLDAGEHGVNRLRKEKQNRTEQRDRKRQQGRTLHEERRNVQERLAAKEAQCEVYRRSLEQLQRELSQLADQGSDEDLQHDLDALRQNLQKQEARLQQLEEEREKSTDSLSAAERAAALTRAQADGMQRDLSLLKNRMAETGEQKLAREKEREQILRQQQETAEQSEREEALQAKLQTQIETAVQTEERLKTQIADTQKCLTNVQNALQTSEEERERNEEVYRKLEKELATHAYRLESAQEKVHRILETVAMELNIDEEAAASKMKQAPQLKTSRQQVRQIKEQLRAIGSFSYESIEEHKEVSERFAFLTDQSEDLKKSGADITEVIRTLEKTMRKQFSEGIAQINQKFAEVFQILFNGGHAELALTGDDVLEAGVQIIARPPGKSRQAISLLSGGEKALTAVALLFAIFETRPSPFCVLDEIDAALDDANIARYKQYLEGFRGKIQFIIITHRKQTMELADIIYGVTMQENSTSRIIPLELADKKKAQSA